MDLKTLGCEDVDWFHLPQDNVQWQTFVNMIVNLQIS
jgi:hypothetical protein